MKLQGRSKLEHDVLYLEAKPLMAGVALLFPRTGGWVTIAHLAKVGAKLFPIGLSTSVREQLVRRAIELANLWARGIAIPTWIGIDLAEGELVSPPHPDAIVIEDSIICPPRQGGDKAPYG